MIIGKLKVTIVDIVEELAICAIVSNPQEVVLNDKQELVLQEYVPSIKKSQLTCRRDALIPGKDETECYLEIDRVLEIIQGPVYVPILNDTEEKVFDSMEEARLEVDRQVDRLLKKNVKYPEFNIKQNKDGSAPIKRIA